MLLLLQNIYGANASVARWNLFPFQHPQQVLLKHNVFHSKILSCKEEWVSFDRVEYEISLKVLYDLILEKAIAIISLFVLYSLFISHALLVFAFRADAKNINNYLNF